MALVENLCRKFNANPNASKTFAGAGRTKYILLEGYGIKFIVDKSAYANFEFNREVEVYEAFQGKRNLPISFYFGHMICNGYKMIVLSHITGLTLGQLIRTNILAIDTPRSQIRMFIASIIGALIALANNGLQRHGDLHLGNIMFLNNNRAPFNYKSFATYVAGIDMEIKIIDFGRSVLGKPSYMAADLASILFGMYYRIIQQDDRISGFGILNAMMNDSQNPALSEISRIFRFTVREQDIDLVNAKDPNKGLGYTRFALYSLEMDNNTDLEDVLATLFTEDT